MARSHVPNECHFIAALKCFGSDFVSFEKGEQAHPRNESISCLIRCQVNRHNIARVTVEALQQLPGLDVPQSARRVAATR